MKIAPKVLDAFALATVDGHALRLPQLSRALYRECDIVLRAAGGCWNRRAKAHVFAEDPTVLLNEMRSSGTVVTDQDFGYYPTPPAVAVRLLELAELSPGLTVLEPSAGRGAVARSVAAAGCVVDCIELREHHAAVLQEESFARTVQVADFLTCTPQALYDRVVMNPPFARGTDIRHVEHARGFLKDDGLLVAVMSAGATFHKSRAATEFRATVEQSGGFFEELPEKSFQSSGTLNSTVIVVIPGEQRTAAVPARREGEAPPAHRDEQLRSPMDIARDILRDLHEAQEQMQALMDDLGNSFDT
ncbi:MAG: methyltransferase [Streptomycetaceae bacterium]|nr:methyltransferase [Streptomycetaceae bacterium]